MKINRQCWHRDVTRVAAEVSSHTDDHDIVKKNRQETKIAQSQHLPYKLCRKDRFEEIQIGTMKNG